LIRVGLDVPAGAEFAIDHVDDPFECAPATNDASLYRRPLPSTNLRFLSAVMWDGRESRADTTIRQALARQANDATRGHAQGGRDLTTTEVEQIVAFETGLFTAQARDNEAGNLRARGATGGPVDLSRQPFFIGINDPLGGNPNETPFTSSVFNLFQSWLNAGSRRNYGHGTPMATDELLRRVNISDVWRWNEHELDRVNEHRRSVARGEQVFNTKKIVIAGVAGLNDKLGVDHVDGFCGTCHDAPNVGNHSVKLPIDIGVPDAGDKKPPVLDIAGLPVFTLTCSNVAEGNPLKGKVYQVTDLGKAMISGKCADIGLFKGPILRGLAARAPYFHNGGAANLRDVVDFYDKRFSIGFTDREKHDLVNFLKTL